MKDTPSTEAEARTLRYLKMLVTTLTAVMIVGLITIIALFVIRFPSAAPAVPKLPDPLTLPAGEVAEAVTAGPGWTGIVTRSGRILIYDAAGHLRQSVTPTAGAGTP